MDEGIEISGPAGTNLACYRLVAYNGGDSKFYMNLNLSGTIPDQCDGYGTVWFSWTGLQNGAPDGVALYNTCTSTVIQFLSYEGVITAADGPAIGMTSVNIGVDEDPEPAVGNTLQLTGTGTTYTDFSWTGPSANSRGSVNTGQDFGCAAITPEKFVFTFTPPYCTNKNTNFSTTVCATDNSGNLASTFMGSATLSKNSGPGTLSGTTSLTFVNGCATVSNLQFNLAGNYTLKASNGTLTDGISPTIVIADSCEKCIEIKSIMVDACGGLTEGLQEMVQFETGETPVNTSDLTVEWPFNSYLGICQDANTAAFVANTNATITGGGSLVQPPGGIIPANAKVLLVTSSALVSSAMSFVDLNYTLYVIFQCAGNTNGHFKNYCTPACGDRTLVMNFGSGCSDTVKYEPNELLNQAGNPGEQDGATVTYTNSGEPTYGNNGCVAPFAPPLEATITSTDPSCNGGSNGSATATPVGGTAPYIYLWSTGATSQTISSLTAGTYSVIIEDDYFFQDTAYVTIGQPTVITSSASTVQPTCPCDATGSLNLSASGGTPPYTYLWSNSNTTEDLSSITAGTYTVTITDSKSCTASFSYILGEPPGIAISLVSQINVSCFGMNNGQFQVQVNGGTAPYDFSIDGGASYVYNNIAANTPVLFSSLLSGNYVIKVRDGNGCMTH